MAYTMAEAARKLGVSVTLIRRYEREFNLAFARTEQGRCVLTEQDLDNLATICAQRDQDVPVSEIREQIVHQPGSALVAAETEHVGPDVREVLAALVSRQDQLEVVIKEQGAAIQRLRDENLQLLESNEKMLLQIEAPAEEKARLAEEREKLWERMRHLEHRADDAERAIAESAKDEIIRKLQRRLLDLEAAVATELSENRDQEEGLLDELARAIAQQSLEPRRPWWRFWR